MKNENTTKKIGTITIANGTGNDPITVDCYPGDTVAKVLKRADLVLEDGTTVSLGRKKIDNINKTTVAPGDTLVIAGKVSNG